MTLPVKVFEPKSGLYMGDFIEAPGIQFFSGYFIDGGLIGKSGTIYNYRSSLSLEIQHNPDRLNQSTFPSIIPEPRQTYATTTMYKFSLK